MNHKRIITVDETADKVIVVGIEDDGSAYVSSADILDLPKYTEPDTEAAYAHGYSNAETKYKAQVKEAYQKGLSDAWEAARKIVTTKGIPADDMAMIFDDEVNYDYIFSHYSASECIEKIRQYEQEKEEQIQVGDEVDWMGNKYVVTFVRCEAKKADLISCKFGSACENVAFSALVKTGRRFPEIVAVLEKMREGQDG